MAKIEEFSDVRDKELVRKLIKENIDKQWLRELILGKKGIGPSGGQSSNTLVDNFEIYVWDNLSEEQKNKVIESLNLIIEEDLFLEKQPEMNYWSHLLDFAVLLEKKLPGKVNSKPFLIWKERSYPNLRNYVEIEYSTKLRPERIKELDQIIESAFRKKS